MHTILHFPRLFSRNAPYSNLLQSLHRVTAHSTFPPPPNCRRLTVSGAATPNRRLLRPLATADPTESLRGRKPLRAEALCGTSTMKATQAVLPFLPRRIASSSHVLSMSQRCPSSSHARRPPMPVAALPWQNGSVHNSRGTMSSLAGYQALQRDVLGCQPKFISHKASGSLPKGRSPSPPSATAEASEELLPPPPDAAPAPEDTPEPTPNTAEDAEKHKQRVRDALVTGQLGFGFSAGGFLYCYHLGVLWELERLGVLRQGNGTLMAGASAGSLAIVTFNCGISPADALGALRAFASDCRKAGTRYRLSGVLREFLTSYLPPDAHERCSGVCHVSLTRLPYMRHEAISQFHDKNDLVEALLTSCHIPVYASGTWTTKFRGSTYVDGGVTHFVPSPPSPTVIKVCCFPVSQMLDKMRPTLRNIRRASSITNIAVSPDAYEQCEPSWATLVKWALAPAEDDVLDWLIDKGRRDANAWAQSLGLEELVIQPQPQAVVHLR